MELTTAEVCARAREILHGRGLAEDVTRAIFNRIRAQYAGLEPVRRVPPQTLLWPPYAPEFIADNIAREARA